MRKSENILSEKELPVINERIKQLIDHYAGGSVKLFSEQVKLASSQKLNRIFNIDKRNSEYPEVSSDILIAIANMYSIVDVNWILTGRGSMLRGEQKQPETQSADQTPIVQIFVAELSKKDAKIEELTTTITKMTGELATLKAQVNNENKEKEPGWKVGDVTEAFTEDLSESYGKSSLPTTIPSTSRSLSVGKT